MLICIRVDNHILVGRPALDVPLIITTGSASGPGGAKLLVSVEFNINNATTGCGSRRRRPGGSPSVWLRKVEPRP